MTLNLFPASGRPTAVHTLRLKHVEAIIWYQKRSFFGQARYSVSLQRHYLWKATKQYKTTTRMGRDDIPLAVMALKEAYKWILVQEDAWTGLE